MASVIRVVGHWSTRVPSTADEADFKIAQLLLKFTWGYLQVMVDEQVYQVLVLVACVETTKLSPQHVQPI
jgi:hypothetical protein